MLFPLQTIQIGALQVRSLDGVPMRIVQIPVRFTTPPCFQIFGDYGRMPDRQLSLLVGDYGAMPIDD